MTSGAAEASIGFMNTTARVESTPNPGGVIGTWAALVLQYVIFALAVLLVLMIVAFSGIDTGYPLSAADARGALWIAGVAEALMIPAVLVMIVRNGRYKTAFIIAALVPPVCNLLVLGGIGDKAALLSKLFANGVIVTPMVLRDNTIPSGSYVTKVSETIFAVVLPAGATFGGVPLAGRFQVDLRGDVITPASLARDTVIEGVPCSAAHPVTFSGKTLASCFVAKGTAVDGIRCSPNAPVMLEGEPNRRVRCLLASSVNVHGIVWPAGTHIDLPADAYTVGDAAPAGLRFFNKPFAKGMTLRYFGAAGIDVMNGGKIYCIPGTLGKCYGTPISAHDVTLNGIAIAPSVR